MVGIADYVFGATKVNFNGGNDPSRPADKKPEIKAAPLNRDGVQNLVDTMGVGWESRQNAEKEFQKSHQNWAGLREGIGGRLLTGGLIAGMYAMLHHIPLVEVGAVFGSMMAIGASVKGYNLKQNIKHAGDAQIIAQDNALYAQKYTQAAGRLQQLQDNPDAKPVILEAQKTSLADEYQALYDTVYGPAAAKDIKGGQVLGVASTVTLGTMCVVEMVSSDLNVLQDYCMYGAAEAVAIGEFVTADTVEQRQERRAKATVEFYEGQQGVFSNFAKKVSPEHKRQEPTASGNPGDGGLFGGLKNIGKMFGM